MVRSIRFTDEQYKDIQEAAKKLVRSINWYVVNATREQVKRDKNPDVLDRIEKLVDNCSGDEGDCGALHDSLVELFDKFER